MRAAGAALAVVLATAASGSVLAQGWSWPWDSPKPRPPVPQEPVYRGAPGGGYPPPGYPGQGYPSQGYPPPGYQGQPAPGQPPGGYAQSNRPPICLQLEQKLAQEATRGNLSRDALPRIEQDIRAAERDFQLAQSRLERADCFEYFLFSKTVRNTRTCSDLSNASEVARQRLSDLTSQRQQILGTGSSKSYQDEIVRELARNNCGASYQREASRSNPFSSIWQDEDSSAGSGGQFGALPYATYRTICVRLCDGYFFPVSFSTLPTYFERDEEICQSRCAAPVELYYHQNPGGSVDQSVSARSRQLYTTLKTAFRYRREYVQGCSCKQAEYLPTAGQPGEKRAESGQGAASGGNPQAFSPKR